MTHHLVWEKNIGQVEERPHLFRGHAFQESCDGFRTRIADQEQDRTANIRQRLFERRQKVHVRKIREVQVIRGQNDLTEHVCRHRVKEGPFPLRERGSTTGDGIKMTRGSRGFPKVGRLDAGCRLSLAVGTHLKERKHGRRGEEKAPTCSRTGPLTFGRGTGSSVTPRSMNERKQVSRAEYCQSFEKEKLTGKHSVQNLRLRSDLPGHDDELPVRRTKLDGEIHMFV